MKRSFFYFSIVLIAVFDSCQGPEGQVGPSGQNGLNSLVNVTNEIGGINCENGGIKIEVGIDNNSNGLLDGNEILATNYICNGIEGNMSLISMSTEPIGTNCEYGGIKIDSGIDTNRNGKLDEDEITATAYVCNGMDGDNSLTKIVSEPTGPYCENGGIKIESGIDLNGNGALDEDEVQVTRYVCNGIDGGFDEQLRFNFNYSANTSSTVPIIGGELINFRKSYFHGVDSIVFAANPYVGDASNKALVELYNLTDEVVIANSLISTNQLSKDRVFIYTENLFDYLPDSEITLGIRFSSETNGQFAGTGTPYLFLYRKK